MCGESGHLREWVTPEELSEFQKTGEWPPLMGPRSRPRGLGVLALRHKEYESLLAELDACGKCQRSAVTALQAGDSRFSHSCIRTATPDQTSMPRCRFILGCSGHRAQFDAEAATVAPRP